MAGFSLIEMLTVIAILAVLASLMIPAASRVKARGQTAKCGENVRRISAAIHMYAADNEGSLPYSYYQDTGLQLWWHREIAPYIGFDWEKIFPNASDAWTKNTRLPDIFCCPADSLWGKTYAVDPSYGINHQLTKTIPHGGYPVGTPRTRLVAVERHSEKILLADSGHAEEDGDVAWRIGKVQDSQAPKARHNGSGTVGWLDGHVTLETAARLKELRKEPSPWPHWEIPK